MDDHFREILDSPSREPSDQALVDCVLDAVRHGEPMPHLAKPLLAVIRDPIRWSSVRKSGLYAFARVTAGQIEPLVELLDDVHSERTEDCDDELLGILLDDLYPHAVLPESVFDYLHPPKEPNLIGHYLMFWVHELPIRVVDDDLPVLLDELAARSSALINMRHGHLLVEMTGKLLAQGIEKQGDNVSDERLYTWLGTGLDEHGHCLLDRNHRERIDSWLTVRPDRYKGVLAYCMRHCFDDQNIHHRIHNCSERLYSSTPPCDLGLWYLLQAEVTSSDGLGQRLFEEAVSALIYGRGSSGLSLDFFEAWVAERPEYKAPLQSMLSCEIPEWRVESANRDRKHEAERRNRKNEWLHFFRRHLQDIRRGTAYPQVMHDLATAYFGHRYEARGDTPLEKLRDFLDQDEELIEAALSGFRNVLSREDLPTVAEIVELEAEGRMHLIRLPCLIGAELVSKTDADRILSLDDAVLKRLVAFRYTYAVGSEPNWLRVVVRKRPDLFSAVFVSYASQMLSSAKEHITGVYAVAHNDDYAEVARHAVPSLLETFPLRARKNQLSVLENLLKAGLRHLAKPVFSSLIERKLQSSRMDIAQRVYWIACGLIVDPERYESVLFGCIRRSKVRARCLAGFFHGNWILDQSLPETSSAILITLLAPLATPERNYGAGRVTRVMETADLVRALIDRLGGTPMEAAALQLEHLQTDPNLEKWRRNLRHASLSQKASRREALYRHPSVQAVENTLANLEPANAADLAALTLSYLRELADWIRHDNTDPFKQFWNEDPHCRPTTPKSEDSCRHVLLGKLQNRLTKLGIDAQPEGHYADDKRADIRVSFGGARGFNVPVEIKRDKHRDVWNAMNDQLIPRYTRDPGAAGYGIYLVFWFGLEGMAASPSGKNKPETAEELEDQLRNTLPPEKQKLINVCVIDVSADQGFNARLRPKK